MKFDKQMPLTAFQFERLKPSKNLKADLAIVLPKTKLDRIKVYLNDPAWLLRVVRSFKGKPAYVLLRMKRPIEIFSFRHEFYRVIEKQARLENVTINQFINGAIRHELDVMKGKK